ncbi:MAG: T9SS type A sorting domain-containing protein, partial [Bacteroidales bacterium]|nr:T9SS type A sorting domain-containing protein [Bacteroidales bacterium]
NNNPNFDWYIDDVKVQVFDNAFGSGSDITSGDWNDASMWGNGTPDSNDDVIINANVNIPDGVVAEANQIVINTDTINTGGKAQKFGKLTIADGGQLKVRNSVEATLQKTITASETKTSNAWYVISSPVNNIAIEDFVQGTHNVYRYDEPSMMWQEYRNDDNNFENLTNGRGYLYRSTAANIEFTGDINVGEVSYPLSYASTDNRFKGFNLIGNPYPHNIYKGENAAIPNTWLEDGFYTLTESGAWSAGTDNSTAIKPNTGILVQAKSNANGQDLIFTDTDHQGPSAKSGDDNIIFTVKNSEYSDVAYVLFKEGRGLNKIEHRNADIPMLYVINNGEDFAIADMNDNTKLINLGFEAKIMGQYTIRVKAEGDFSYMHLVDKLTGNDIDMLLEDSYTFIGTPGDRLDRFVLRLEYSGANTDSEIFAYQSGSDIIVSGEGELQVYDLMGRMVATQQINGVGKWRAASVETGIYIFKLNGKTQKMIIR